MKANIQNQEFIERLCEGNKLITSPCISEREEIYLASYDGFIYKYKDENLIPLFEVGGQPNGLYVHNNIAYIADFGHQCILAKSIVDKGNNLSQLVKDFEGNPLIGPNSLVVNSAGSNLKRFALFHRFWNTR